MPEEKEAVKEVESSKKSPIKFLVIGLVLMIIIPVIGFFVASKFIFQEAKEEEVAEDVREVGLVHSHKVVVVNIANTRATRYLRAGVSFEVPTENVVAELIERESQISDLLIMILSNKELDDLVDFSGKNLIRKEIVEKINGKLVSGKIKNVYFTEFVIQ